MALIVSVLAPSPSAPFICMEKLQSPLGWVYSAAVNSTSTSLSPATSSLAVPFIVTLVALVAFILSVSV